MKNMITGIITVVAILLTSSAFAQDGFSNPGVLNKSLLSSDAKQRILVETKNEIASDFDRQTYRPLISQSHKSYGSACLSVRYRSGLSVLENMPNAVLFSLRKQNTFLIKNGLQGLSIAEADRVLAACAAKNKQNPKCYTGGDLTLSCYTDEFVSAVKRKNN